MRWFIVLLGSLIFTFVSWSAVALSSSKTDHLFFIERSKNKNLVQYDVRLTENDNIVDSDPVSVYWVLGNGMQQDLNLVQRRFAYGSIPMRNLGRASSGSFLSLSKIGRSSLKRWKVLSGLSLLSMTNRAFSKESTWNPGKDR